MSIHEEVELLKGVPLFAKLEPNKLKLLAFTSERLTFAPGQELCHQGDIGDAMYVVLGGAADIIIDTPSGPLKVAELKKNGFVGEIAILCDVPRTATVTVRETLTALKITKELFFRMVTEFPTMAVEIMRELAHRLDDTNRQLSAMRARAA
jgi:CRP/FNR family cyclic AMP-dependent transcriptional regulator